MPTVDPPERHASGLDPAVHEQTLISLCYLWAAQRIERGVPVDQPPEGWWPVAPDLWRPTSLEECLRRGAGSANVALSLVLGYAPDTTNVTQSDLHQVESRMESEVMATEQDLQAAISQVQGDVARVRDTLAGEIAALNTKIASGSVTQADLDGLTALHQQLSDPNFAQPTVTSPTPATDPTAAPADPTSAPAAPTDTTAAPAAPTDTTAAPADPTATTTAAEPTQQAETQ